MQNDGSGEKMNSTNHSEMNKRIEVPNKFQSQLKEVFDGYILLKDALVDDNSEEAQTAAKRISQNLAKVNMKLFKILKLMIRLPSTSFTCFAILILYFCLRRYG